jgi:hypothetical protein
VRKIVVPEQIFRHAEFPIADQLHFSARPQKAMTCPVLPAVRTKEELKQRLLLARRFGPCFLEV